MDKKQRIALWSGGIVTALKFFQCAATEHLRSVPYEFLRSVAFLIGVAILVALVFYAAPKSNNAPKNSAPVLLSCFVVTILVGLAFLNFHSLQSAISSAEDAAFAASAAEDSCRDMVP